MREVKILVFVLWCTVGLTWLICETGTHIVEGYNQFGQIGGKYVGDGISISIAFFDNRPIVEISQGNDPCYTAVCAKYHRKVLLCENPTRVTAGKQETLPDFKLDYGKTDSLELLWPGVVKQHVLHRTEVSSKKESE